LPAFPAAHYAKVAKLALWGQILNLSPITATFTLQSPGKAAASHNVALETAPVADIEHDAKNIPDTTDYYYFIII